MGIERIESLDDPRVAAYRNLRDRTLRGESLFIAEGRLVTHRLLDSDFEPESVFVAEEFAAEFAARLGERAPLYVAAPKLLLQVVGFNFHRGAMAAGRRRPQPSLDQLLARIDRGGELRLVVLPEITKPENLGLVFRSAGGLGVDGVLLGERCCDPFSRRALRLSMGATLHVPFARADNLLSDLERLAGRRGVEFLATVVQAGAERIDEVRWPRRCGLLLGNEAEGLSAEFLAVCPRRITIPMHAGIDSLNVGVAAGIFLYEMMRRGEPGRS